MMGYIGRHWRGEQHILWSLLVNGLIVFVATIFAAAAVSPYVPATARQVTLLGPIFAVWLVWVVVGTTRAAISTLRDKTAHWALKLIALLVFVGVGLLLLGAANELVIIRHWLLGLY
jgi:hypothetical protein